jgi:putative transposase
MEEHCNKDKKFTQEQIAFALRQAKLGTPVVEIVRKQGGSEQTFYQWKTQYAGLGISELRRWKSLEEENRNVNPQVADLTLDKQQILHDVLS